MLSLYGIGQILLIPVKIIIFIILYPFHGGVPGKYKNDFKRSLIITICRLALKLPAKDQGTLSFLTTNYVLNSIIKHQHPRLADLNNFGKRYDKQSFWVVEAPKRSKQDPILIYLHGGVFYFDTSPQQIEGLLGVYHLLDPGKREKLSMLVLNYKLASKGYPMPHQLTDLVSTYTNLVKEGNNNIILLGDSAGGTLAVNFLQHLRVTDNKLPYPRDVVLISPWVKLVPDLEDYTSGHTFYENEQYDLIQWDASKGFINNYRDLVGDSNYKTLTISPGNCTYSYLDWADVTTFTEKGHGVFVILGENESMRDDILRWSQFALKSTLPLKFDFSEGKFNAEAHEFIKNSPEEAYVEIVIEPLGVHDGSFVLEVDSINEVEKSGLTTIDTLDPEKYFGTIRIVKFLNKVT